MNEKNAKTNVNSIMDTYLISRRYDLRQINHKHPLWGNVSKIIKLHINDDNPVDTYFDYAGVVFDDSSYNFHIFPKDKDIYRELSQEFLKLQDKLCKYIAEENVELPNKATLKKKSGGNWPFVRFENIEEIVMVSNDKKFSVEFKEGKIIHYNIYHYVTVNYNNAYYTINFMRYTCDSKGVVGCTMRAIQFHKSYGNINKANGFNICYTLNDENNTYKSIIYNVAKNNEEIICENVCYNPPVQYPFNDLNEKEKTDRIENIIDWFIYFIEKEGKKEDMTLDKYKKWKMTKKK